MYLIDVRQDRVSVRGKRKPDEEQRGSKNQEPRQDDTRTEILFGQ
jgi:hypothetical protein